MNNVEKKAETYHECHPARPRLRSAVRAGEMGAVSQAVSSYAPAPNPACYGSSNWGSDYANERY